MNIPIRSVVAYTACLVILGTSGCSTDYYYEAVPVINATLTRQVDGVATFHVTGAWGDTQGEYSHCEATREGHTYTVQMFGRRPSDNLIRPAVIQIDGRWSVHLGQPGEYRFEFWRGTEDPIVQVIVVE